MSLLSFVSHLCRRHRIRAADTSLGLHQTHGSTGDGKRKCSSGSVIEGYPETPMVSPDNGSADRQTDSHSVVLCRIESFEELVRDLRCKTDSCIFYAKAYLILLNPIGSDEQLSRAIVNCAHRLRSIP